MYVHCCGVEWLGFGLPCALPRNSFLLGYSANPALGHFGILGDLTTPSSAGLPRPVRLKLVGKYLVSNTGGDRCSKTSRLLMSSVGARQTGMEGEVTLNVLVIVVSVF